jgi:amidohydrolase
MMRGPVTDLERLKVAANRAVDEIRPSLQEVALAIHADPELAYEEHHASDRLAGLLTTAGLDVERPYRGLQTSFAAELRCQGGPVVALCAEYDALPGIGHACGHNLMGTASVGALLALRAVSPNLGGTVRVVGTPAEERGNGKVRLISAGAFRDVDAAMMFHAGSADELDPLMLAMVSLEVEYIGKAAHAAAKPHLGVNALDAMIMAYNNLSALRQVIRSDSRLHGIITHGGDAPNIIPARAAGRFMVRSPDNRYLEQLKVKVQRCFEGAATATGAEVRLSWLDQCDTLTTNAPIAEAFAANAATLGRPMRRRSPNDSHGSTDMGNVSTLVPSIHPYFAIAPAGTPTHSVEFARYAATPPALDAMIVAAKALAMTTLDLLSSPELTRRAKQAHPFNG